MTAIFCVIMLFAAEIAMPLNAAAAPSEIAGFTLGANIHQYEDRVDMGTALPIRDMKYLEEVETKSIQGFRKGYLVFGTCFKPGRIVRIKLKYWNNTRKFFDRLLNDFKKKFGDPSEWRGDPFYGFVAWKWSFKDKEGNSISMILQHGEEELIDRPAGNAVKITNWTHIEEEQRCYEIKHPTPPEENESESKWMKAHPDFENLIPR